MRSNPLLIPASPRVTCRLPRWVCLAPRTRQPNWAHLLDWTHLLNWAHLRRPLCLSGLACLRPGGLDPRADAPASGAVDDYVPGGWLESDIRRLIEQALSRPRPTVASICAANAVPARLGFLKGREASRNRWADEQGAKPEQAIWVDRPLVSDGPFLTAHSDQAGWRPGRRAARASLGQIQLTSAWRSPT